MARPAALHTDVVERPIRFEHHRYLGDKRSQIVYDVDAMSEDDAQIIAELLASERFICFGPDTLAEARNRGYRLWKGQRHRPTGDEAAPERASA
jgi:hypothetical protein